VPCLCEKEFDSIFLNDFVETPGIPVTAGDNDFSIAVSWQHSEGVYEVACIVQIIKDDSERRLEV
jgi:hypothetical protein